jgi:hypothetical protein
MSCFFFFVPGKGKEYWGENINEEMPACRQMFNIFHPFDPVAYRSAVASLSHCSLCDFVLFLLG